MLIKILAENQIIDTYWNTLNREYYETKGYKFTGYNTLLQVNVKDLSSNSSKKVKVICDYCGETFGSSYQNYNKVENRGFQHACDKCVSKNRSFARIKKNSERQIKKFNEWCKVKGYQPITTVDTYSGCKNFQFMCLAHGIQSIPAGHIRPQSGCKYCLYETRGNKFKITLEEVKKRVESKNNNKLLNVNDYKDVNEKNLRIICGSCGCEFVSSLEIIRNGDGRCINCAHKATGITLTHDKNYIEKTVNSINGNILMNKEDYCGAGVHNLKISCGTCNHKHIFITSFAHYQRDKNRCDYCKQSISDGELRIQKYLEKYSIEYERQKKYDDCKDKRKLPFDIFVKKYNCCIEYDGIQHFKPIRGEEQLKITHFHDELKNKYCLDNNIKLIRIPYFYYNQIEEILDQELLEITKYKSIKIIPKSKTI